MKNPTNNDRLSSAANRRSFLKGIAGSAAMLPILPHSLGPAQQMSIPEYLMSTSPLIQQTNRMSVSINLWKSRATLCDFTWKA